MEYRKNNKVLFQIISNSFNWNELLSLCDELALDHENIEGSTKERKAWELIKYCRRRGLFFELIDVVANERPGLKSDLINLRNFFQQNLQAKLYLTLTPFFYKYRVITAVLAFALFFIMVIVSLAIIVKNPFNSPTIQIIENNSPLPTVAPTPTPLLQARNLYYMFIVDASSRMAVGDENGQTKWSLIKNNVLIHIFDGLVERSNYGLILMGGNKSQPSASCQDDWQNLVPLDFDTHNDLKNSLTTIEPDGEAPLTEALKNARTQLFSIPEQAYVKKHLFIFIGGGDSCDENEWERPIVVLEDSLKSLEVNTDLVLLDFEQVEDKALEILNADLEYVTVHIANTPEEAVQIVETVVIKANEEASTVAPLQVAAQQTRISETKMPPSLTTSNALVTITAAKSPTTPPTPTQTSTSSTTPKIESSELTNTQTPTSPTTSTPAQPLIPTSQPPISTATNPPLATQSIQTITPTATSTPSGTPTPSPTPTPTATFIQPTTLPTPTPSRTPTPLSTSTRTPVPPSSTPTDTPTTTPEFIINTLPDQDVVFSPGCWLINPKQTTEYHRFFQNQANLDATLITNGRTGQGLKLTITNVYGPGGRYAGWEVLLGTPDTGLDFSNYTSLIFYIRGANSIEKPPPNIYLMMPQTTENFERFWKDVAEITTITTSWQQIIIPLSHFETSTEQNQQVSLENIHKIQILFEWFSSPTSGEIYIDDLCVQ